MSPKGLPCDKGLGQNDRTQINDGGIHQQDGSGNTSESGQTVDNARADVSGQDEIQQASRGVNADHLPTTSTTRQRQRTTVSWA